MENWIWRDASRFKHLDANKVHEEGLEIYKEFGNIEGQTVVNWAREHKDSEYYKGLEWNDTVAGEAFRVIQARQITSGIILNDYTDKDNATDTKVTIPVNTRAFYNVERGKGYEPVEIIMKNEDKYESLKQEALNRFLSLKKQYQFIVELKPIFDAIDKLF